MEDPPRSTSTSEELITEFRRTSARAAVDLLDDSVDSVERAQKALRLYQEHLERSNPVFNRKKEKAPPDLGRTTDQSTNWQVQTPAAQDIAKPAEPTMVEQLRKRRAEKVQLANQLDEDVMALDHEITWLERHPGSEYVIKEFVRKHEEEIERHKRGLDTVR